MSSSQVEIESGPAAPRRVVWVGKYPASIPLKNASASMELLQPQSSFFFPHSTFKLPHPLAIYAMTLSWIAATACVLLAWRVWSILPYRRRRRKPQQSAQSAGEKNVITKNRSPHRTVNTLVVLGSGASKGMQSTQAFQRQSTTADFAIAMLAACLHCADGRIL